MDPDSTEIALVLHTASNGGTDDVASRATALAFDTTQELLWTGNGQGRVASYYGTEMQNYVSYIMQPPSDGEVRQILINETGVISLGPKGLHMALRRGLPLWNCRHEDMANLTCMAFTSTAATHVLVAGNQDVMFVVDLKDGTVTKQLEAKNHYNKMKRNSRHICAATTHGSVDIIDPANFSVVKSWSAHSAFIQDMDVQNDFLVTCGATLKNQGTVMYDPYVNAFDMKQLTSMAPIPFPPCAAFVRMHPRMGSTAIVASASGQIHTIDLLSPNSSIVKQANIVTYLTGIEISPTGEALVLADNDCYLRLWGSPTRIQFNGYPVMIETETPEEPHKDTCWEDWSDDENEDTLPLNTVGMPYYRDTLLSAFPPLMTADVGASPPRYDGAFLENLTQFEYGWYAPNMTGTLPNQVEDTRKDEKPATQTIRTPKFLSDRSRETVASRSTGKSDSNGHYNNSSNNGSNSIIDDDTDDAMASSELASLGPEAPSMYRTVEIKFSKFGVDDFDFGYYNHTGYAGLENHFANSYANSLLQLLNFTPSIRNLALQHAASACLDENCLLCELGYLCDMLQKAEGVTCQATNMLKTLSSLPQAHQLRLIEEENPNAPITEMLQNLTRFLLGQIAGDFRRMQPESNAMEETLATSGTTYMRCMQCRSETRRAVSTYVNNLKYPAPQRNSSRVNKQPRITFSQVLKSSVEQDSSTKGWCENCKRYQTLLNRKTISSIPSVLTLNASGPQNLNYPEFRRLWGTPGWLPEEIGIIVDGAGQFFCYEGEDLKLHLQRGIHNIKVYSLVGMVANVDNGGQPPKSHLVGMINVGYSEPTAPPKPQWHLFNDFLVKQTSSGEALSFNTNWKTPSVVIFQLKSYNNKLDTTWKSRIDTSILYMNYGRQTGINTYQPLNPHAEKLPGPDTIVALDTEFVALKQPEIEMNADGEMETIRPMTHALARVSVVRGQGQDEGVTFIDDYIEIKEPVVDYLTLYSGITSVDLDPKTSQHTLVPLKMAYKKLWVLLNLGCKFLGHGMKQDFRVINIQVPQAQIIDTISLFFLKSRLRKLSLAFLAWYVLKENIQMDTHDSIEDARTALKLYRKYQEYKDAGILEQRLQEIYREGRDTNFKPPKRESDHDDKKTAPPVANATATATSATGSVASTPSPMPLQPLTLASSLAPPLSALPVAIPSAAGPPGPSGLAGNGMGIGIGSGSSLLFSPSNTIMAPPGSRASSGGLIGSNNSSTNINAINSNSINSNSNSNGNGNGNGNNNSNTIINNGSNYNPGNTLNRGGPRNGYVPTAPGSYGRGHIGGYGRGNPYPQNQSMPYRPVRRGP